MKYTNLDIEPIPLTDAPPVRTALAVPILLVAFFVALSYPLYALSVAVGALVGARVLQYGLAALVARNRGRVRAFSLPGVGTVEFRVTPQ
ncbi:hypothetical protein [Natronomonas marina]|jgi:hypothetical protein|uniref:hypothetical protein n=1 Tax=Natronomonas marina TaxID=2961939 RepID=UPI0020C9ED8B|nr:hypothetical protein [Natronomonas marina]